MIIKGNIIVKKSSIFHYFRDFCKTFIDKLITLKKKRKREKNRTYFKKYQDLNSLCYVYLCNFSSYKT